ncbi:collagen-like triple helix repeat-containing protein [Flagellimonas maritima]|nr:collagen-like protein [Allomuricauda aurantiaca]
MRFKLFLGLCFITSLFFMSCSGEDGEQGIQGKQGETGQQGEAGLDGETGPPVTFYFEDFEGLSDDIPPIEFVQSENNDVDWSVAILNFGSTYSLNHSLVSGDINDNESSEISISFTSESTSLIEFDVFVRSEADSDFILWSLNNQVVEGVSGFLSRPIRIRFTAEAGENVLTFTYEKDELTSVDLDRAYVDNLLINNVASTGKINLGLPELPEGATYYNK